MKTGLRAVVAVAVAVVCVWGCSALIDPAGEPVLCVVPVAGEMDPCGEPSLVCVRDSTGQGICRDRGSECTTSQPETCNAEDDDCDGGVDEGFDRDEDGITWCGDAVDPATGDCDDSDPTVYPRGVDGRPAPEVCDGNDNDCDRLTDEDNPDLCPAGLSCVDAACVDPNDCTVTPCGPGECCAIEMVPPRCVAAMMVCTNDGDCGPGERCDVPSGNCVTPAPIGVDCAVDSQCASGICAPKAAARLGGGRFCTLSCCVDTDCPDGSVCWASGTGAKLCVDPMDIGTGRGPTRGGSACTSNPDCASGLCVSSQCLGNCGRNGDCASGQACRSRPIDLGGGEEHRLLWCAPPGTGAGVGQDCMSADDCAGGLCVVVTFGPVILGRYCATGCHTSNDCPGSFYCGYLGDPDARQVCLENTHFGTGMQGASCTTGSECQDRLCRGGTCAKTCCSDTDCAGGRRCRPVGSGDTYETHCF